MATKTETPPDAALNTTREPKGTNRMAGDKDTSDGAKAVNDALMIVVGAWIVLAILALSLRDFLNG